MPMSNLLEGRVARRSRMMNYNAFDIPHFFISHNSSTRVSTAVIL
jgi:hypothetical protein